jgi:hypothetical protein
MARVTKGLDRNSATWQFVAGWAAREILKARAAAGHLQGRGPGIALRERIRTLKELLTVDDREKKKDIKTKDHRQTFRDGSL